MRASRGPSALARAAGYLGLVCMLAVLAGAQEKESPTFPSWWGRCTAVVWATWAALPRSPSHPMATPCRLRSANIAASLLRMDPALNVQLFKGIGGYIFFRVAGEPPWG